jgi:hypothetical protein
MSLFVVEEVLALLRLLGVLLLHLARHRVSESDDEVNLGTHSTLVRAKHDGVWSLVIEFRLDEENKKNILIKAHHTSGHCG